MSTFHGATKQTCGHVTEDTVSTSTLTATVVSLPIPSSCRYKFHDRLARHSWRWWVIRIGFAFGATMMTCGVGVLVGQYLAIGLLLLAGGLLVLISARVAHDAFGDDHKVQPPPDYDTVMREDVLVHSAMMRNNSLIVYCDNNNSPTSRDFRSVLPCTCSCPCCVSGRRHCCNVAVSPQLETEPTG